MRSVRNPLPPRHDGPAVVAVSRARGIVCGIALATAALIHLLPLPGLLGTDALRTLYGVAIVDPDLLLLLRHRALLFGLLGAGLLASIRMDAWRTPMLAAGIASTAGFLLLALDTPGFGAALQRVVVADIVALVALLLAAALSPRRATKPRA